MPKGKRIEPLNINELEASSSLSGMMAFRDTPIGPAPIGSSVVIHHSQPDLEHNKEPLVSSDYFSPIGLPPIGKTAALRARTHQQMPGHREEALAAKISSSSSSPVGVTPVGVTPVGARFRSRGSPDGQPELDKPIDHVPPVGVISVGPLPSDLTDVFTQLAETPPVAKSRGKVVPATKVEDGHSVTQNAIYWHLWRKGKYVSGRRSHFIQAGYGQIQSALGIDRSNVQDAIRELQKKLSIQVIKASTVGSATIYEIFCCEEILEKRRAAGLVWAQQYGARKVELLTNPDRSGLLPIGATPIGLVPEGVAPPVGDTPILPIGLPPTGGIGVAPIQLSNGARSNKPPSSDVAQVRHFIQSKIAPIDNDGVERLLKDCRIRAGNQSVTVDHILSVIVGKVAAARSARNPVGLLIESVPKHFPLAVPTVQQSENGNPQSSDQEYWEQVAMNEDAPEPLKEEARRELKKAGYRS